MLLLKMLIQQQMKQNNITYSDLALKSGVPYKKLLTIIDGMSTYECFIYLEKIMVTLGLFNFDDATVDELMKKELKKKEKTKESYVNKTIKSK